MVVKRHSILAALILGLALALPAAPAAASPPPFPEPVAVSAPKVEKPPVLVLGAMAVVGAAVVAGEGVVTRAKFRLNSITDYGPNSSRTLNFQAVLADEIPENQRFNKASPNGKLELMINNPAAYERFEPGKSYYLNFTEAPE